MDERLKEILALAAERGVTLPAGYLEFLQSSLPDDWTEVQFGEQPWSPYSIGKLLKKTSGYGKSGVKVPQALEAAAFAVFVAESVKQNEGFAKFLVQQVTDSGFTLDRLSRTFTVGHFNGDPIFIDAKTGGIFICYHDGGDVGPVAKSVEELLAGSKADE